MKKLCFRKSLLIEILVTQEGQAVAGFEYVSGFLSTVDDAQQIFHLTLLLLDSLMYVKILANML